MLSTGPSIWIGSEMLCSMNWNRGLSSRWTMLRRWPVSRLSTQTTSSPSARNRSQRCDPTNPAPPVMMVLIGWVRPLLWHAPKEGGKSATAVPGAYHTVPSGALTIRSEGQGKRATPRPDERRLRGRTEHVAPQFAQPVAQAARLSGSLPERLRQRHRERAAGPEGSGLDPEPRGVH